MAEKEKRRSTTFVTSRGAIINVAAPSVYIAPGVTPVDVTSPAELRNELRPDWLGKEVYYERDLNTFFDARWRDVPTQIDERIDLNEYWNINVRKPLTESSVLSIPVNKAAIGGYSKRVFSYGKVAAQCIFPTNPVGAIRSVVWMGFEVGGGSFTGLSVIRFECTPANPTGTLEVRVTDAHRGVTANITVVMPYNPQVISHVYSVEMTKDAHWFFADTGLVAVVCLVPDEIRGVGPGPIPETRPRGVIANAPPYAVAVVPVHLPSHAPALFEFNSEGVANTWKLERLEAVDGEPRPSRILDLWKWETYALFRGTSIAAGTLTSHPIPTHGFDVKTIHFRADQAGTLNIEYYEGSKTWRAIPNPPTFTANTLLTYNLLDRAMLIRVVVAPTAFPCVIAEAEVALGP